MKPVDPKDPDLVAIMRAAATVLAALPPLPFNDEGRRGLAEAIEQAWQRVAPHRRFQFHVELFPGTFIANVVVTEAEPGDLQ